MAFAKLNLSQKYILNVMMVELLISFVISLESKSFDYHMPICTIIQGDFNILHKKYFFA